MKFDVMVNATSVGMHPQVEISPLAPAELNCSLVFDMVYRPLQTKLLRIAAEKGIQTISGLEMFLAQGIAQWGLWMKEMAPESEMKNAVSQVLRAKEKGHD